MRHATAAAIAATLTLATPAAAQEEPGYGTGYVIPGPNPYGTTRDSFHITAPDGSYRGNLNTNQYDPNSVANPYGRYGSQYSPDSVNNPYAVTP